MAAAPAFCALTYDASVALFEIERGTPCDHPELWEPVGQADATGAHAAKDAIREVSGETGWYRTRLVGDPRLADDPEYLWTYCQVSLNSETGERQIDCPETVSF